ncbi:esterase-like activity of phytase family protein [Salinicola halophilus]|uniref:esterase-like activity of phytase family protein n=1 Tax=Salinicola halophilus TaxID=184065 RepID=UPI0013A61272|nr:esterase-like activity of phytase family protein [Salinicola halophilus]
MPTRSTAPRNPTGASITGALLISTLLAGCSAVPQPTSLATAELEASTPGVSWCGTLVLPSKWQDGTPVGGLSDLGWDEDESMLFLVSDRGWLHRARLDFTGSGELRDYQPLDTYPLRSRQGSILESERSDAESLVLENARDGVRGNTQLVIGFEGDARWQRFYPSGLAGEAPHRSARLADTQPNAGLEGLADLPGFGLIGGIESSPEGWPDTLTRLFTLDGEHEWRYPLASDTNSALTALEALDGDLLVLERAYTPPASVVINLRRAALAKNGSVTVTDLARLSNGEGWSVDNFEGLTRIGDGRYLMVSDDNFSLLQRTLLSCFTIDEANAS